MSGSKHVSAFLSNKINMALFNNNSAWPSTLDIFISTDNESMDLNEVLCFNLRLKFYMMTLWGK